MYKVPSQGEVLVTKHMFSNLPERSITKTCDRKLKPSRFNEIFSKSANSEHE